MYMNLCYLILLAAGCPWLIAVNDEKLTNQADKGYSTSTYAMVELLRIEQNLVNYLKSYAEQLKRKTILLESGLKLMKKNIQMSNKSLEEFSKNPLNKFTLIRQMHMDWKKWLQYLSQKVGSIELKHIKQMQMYRPKYSDLLDARKGMLRIQRIYELTVNDMANGLLDGKQYESKLLVFDCFHIGLEAIDSGDYYSASNWFYTALIGYESKKKRLYIIQGLRFIDIYLLYLKSLLNYNLYARVLQITRQFITVYRQYNMEIQRRRAKWLRDFYKAPKPPKLPNIPELEPYDRACSQKERPIDRTLFCRYNRDYRPFLKLAPLKMEQLSHMPFIVLYHEVIYDSEIEEFKMEAIPDLARGQTVKMETGEIVIDEVRTVNTAFLENYNSAASLRVLHRLFDMTGFTMCCGELFSVMNYGIGGHYGPHCDYLRLDEGSTIREFPERIATVIFYFNDVEQGGATVFPLLNINVQPKKGTALFWHNLDNDGNGNFFTLHYACPVLVGSKWVMSKWIDEFSQMFIKPCLKD